jgi:hypothetical protein
MKAEHFGRVARPRAAKGRAIPVGLTLMMTLAASVVPGSAALNGNATVTANVQ